MKGEVKSMPWRGSGGLVIVDRAGRAVVMSEAERVALALDQVKAQAAVPVECGDDIEPAPARGPMRRFVPREVGITDGGQIRSVRSGYAGRSGAARADAFDLMDVQARRAWRGKDEDFVGPFTRGQVLAGRSYGALCDWESTCGVKLSALDATGGGGSDRGVSEAVMDRLSQLRRMRRAIGDGVALRKLRPSARGSGARVISVRAAVDAVCHYDMTVGQVLRASGWSVNGRTRDGLRKEICLALDRVYDVCR